MKKYLPFVLSVAFTSLSLAEDVSPASSYQEISLSAEFKKSLMTCYGVDSCVADQILANVEPLFANPDHHPILQTFIDESENLKGYLDNPVQSGDPECFPAYHSVLFENNFVRISWAVTKSGVQEPFQVHPWNTLMLIVTPSEFHTELEDGSFYEDNWPIGTYVLGPTLNLLSCKNIGHQEYTALIVEVKTSLLEEKL